MANAFGPYDQIYYAQEALAVLYRTLGFARRVYRRLDASANEIHQTVYFRRPMKFTAASMPNAAATETLPDTVSLTMSNWWGAGISLNDKELAYGKERIFSEHVAPLANAVATKIDATLHGQYIYVPWYVSTANATDLAIGDIVNLRKQLVNNGAPLDNLHLQLSPTYEAEALKNASFGTWSGAGATGADTQITGNLGQRYGFECSMTQAIPTHTAGTCADATGALTAAVLKGATTIAIDNVTPGGTFAAGDTLVIAGNTQRYAITSAVTATGGAATLAISPPAVQAYDNLSVVTITLVSGEQSMAFHRDAFAVVMGALPAPTGVGANADIYTATDATSGLSIRVRRWYDPGTASHKLYCDALWGVTTLDPNLAVRLVDIP